MSVVMGETLLFFLARPSPLGVGEAGLLGRPSLLEVGEPRLPGLPEMGEPRLLVKRGCRWRSPKGRISTFPAAKGGRCHPQDNGSTGTCEGPGANGMVRRVLGMGAK